MRNRILFYKKPENFPSFSQLICSITNFFFNLLGIMLFAKNGFAIWFMVSLVNVFLQSINRSAFLELYAQKKISIKSASSKSIILVILTNFCLWIFCMNDQSLKLTEIMVLIIMFTFYQFQDILRYLILQYDSFLVIKSDTLILILVFSTFIYNVFYPISKNIFMFTNLLAFIFGLLILVSKTRYIFKNYEFIVGSKNLARGMLFSNISIFILSSATIVIMEKFMSLSDLIDYRIIVLWLSPIYTLVRLVYVKKIMFPDPNISKPQLITDAIIISKLFLISLFIAVPAFPILSPEHFNSETMFAMIFGLLTVAINVWTYPLLIAMREYDSAFINGFITAIGAITVFAYVSISLSSINILFLYLVNLVTMVLVAVYLYMRNFNRFKSNPEPIRQN